jgi:predicted small secreted protein
VYGFICVYLWFSTSGLRRKAGYREDPMAAERRGPYDATMNSPLKRLALLLLTASAIALATTGCQTSKGFGKDVEKLGDKIQEKAD